MNVEIVHVSKQDAFDKAIALIHQLKPSGCFGDEEGHYSALWFYVGILKPGPETPEDAWKRGYLAGALHVCGDLGASLGGIAIEPYTPPASSTVQKMDD